MEALLAQRHLLVQELQVLEEEERNLDQELEQQMVSLGLYSDRSPIMETINKVEAMTPLLETLQQNATKMATQVDDCNLLSERLSAIVRQLDLRQMRAQKALACTEDILNMKECRLRIATAIEEKNLTAAVRYLRQVHDIDERAAKTSEDYDAIVEKEQEVKDMVRAAFQSAITESDTSSVMSLCPLLQTLGLEDEARDNFLAFVEQTVFLAVSADASSVATATDPTAGYAQALSGVFNASYLIIQQYLPMVIQGLENSLGDVHFLRRLHKRTEQEAGLVLKRYMKYRNVREMISNIKSMSHPTNSTKASVTAAEVHAVMDEIALLVQYCCKYSRYLKHICRGAESRIRSNASNHNTSHHPTASSSSQAPVVVFSPPLDFDKMVDELVSKYYMEGEQWLLRTEIQDMMPQSPTEDMRLDECFFVLQKCGLRAIASHNIHAACAVLNYIADLITSDVMSQANQIANNAVQKLINVLQEHMLHYRKSIGSSSNEQDSDGSAKVTSLAQGFSSAISIASSFTVGGTAKSSSASGSVVEIKFLEDGSFIISGYGAEDDPWGAKAAVEGLNILELCMRYTDRLGKDLYQAAELVFANEEDQHEEHAGRTPKPTPGSRPRSSSKTMALALSAATLASELDKLKLCKENLDSARNAFASASREDLEQLVSAAQVVMKEILLFSLGRSAPYGGVKFHECDAAFDNQMSLMLLPKLLTVPLETMLNICIFGMSERNKDVIVGMFADGCCEKLEAFIHQTSFSFAGALKMEEIVRAISSLFTKHSSISIRGKFTRLREIVKVLTTDGLTYDSVNYLTSMEVDAFVNLRIDRPAVVMN